MVVTRSIYLCLTTIFFPAEIAYVEAPTPRVFGQLSAKCRFTPETITSYKRLMHDPATAEVWQTVFGKDFGGMAQGNDKTGQKGTNSIFVMTRRN